LPYVLRNLSCLCGFARSIHHFKFLINYLNDDCGAYRATLIGYAYCVSNVFGSVWKMGCVFFGAFGGFHWNENLNDGGFSPLLEKKKMMSFVNHLSYYCYCCLPLWR
jgi:hypothetical protein